LSLRVVHHVLPVLHEVLGVVLGSREETVALGNLKVAHLVLPLLHEVLGVVLGSREQPLLFASKLGDLEISQPLALSAQVAEGSLQISLCAAQLALDVSESALCAEAGQRVGEGR